MSKRMRADRLLVERGLFDSRARAQAAITAGLVRAGAVVVAKPSQELPADIPLEATPAHPYVSRGGLKLAAALDAFAIDPVGLSCLDVGSSTGGFTEVLLRRGATCVTSVDTGSGQLHASLRGDQRIRLHENTDIRRFAEGVGSSTFDLAVIDVSFIPLGLVLPAVAGLLKPGGRLIALVKPQFEAGRAHVGKGGVVRDEAVQLACVEAVRRHLVALGFVILGDRPSPIAGGDGNREFLIGARRA